MFSKKESTYDTMKSISRDYLRDIQNSEVLDSKEVKNLVDSWISLSLLNNDRIPMEEKGMAEHRSGKTQRIEDALASIENDLKANGIRSSEIEAGIQAVRDFIRDYPEACGRSAGDEKDYVQTFKG